MSQFTQNELAEILKWTVDTRGVGRLEKKNLL